ncbi:MAG: PKD domain-containing protein [Methanothrix sp.]
MLIIPSVMGAFPLDCAYQCSANDVQISGAQISDQNGNDLACRFCEPGNPASAYLALTVFNIAAAARYNIYIIYTLSLDGIDQPRTFSCLAASLGGGQTIKAEIPISWTCGQSVDLKNIIITWSTEPSENTCDIPKNCHAPGKSWCTPLLSVKTPLVAAFSSNSPQCICVPQSCQPIQFTDQTTGGSGTYTYQWDLGDGSTSTQKNPLKQYSAPGIYQVTFTVNDGKCSDSHSGQAVVYPAPSASFTSLPGICLGADLHFTDTSTPGTAAGISPASIVKWEWNFGDGSAHSLDQNPVHRYLSAGNYQVTLKVTDSRGCTGSVTSSVQAYTDPVPTFTVDSPTLCFRPALSTLFHGQATDGSGTYSSFAWDFGDGNKGTGPDPTHQYANQGTYNVRLTVTDSHGCTGTTTSQVTIVDCDPPGIDGVTVFSGPICSGLEQVVNAHVVDYVGVSSVVLNLQVDGGAITQLGMTFVAGSGSVKDGLWTVEAPGQPAGSTVTYWITADDGTFTGESAHYSVSFIDCTPPAITSVRASTFHPCAGSDVLITAHATAGTGVSSVTIDYGGASHQMSGPAGSSSGDWTYSIQGSGKAAGDSLIFTVSATDALGRVVHSSGFTITWRDCTPPEIVSVVPSDLSPCPPSDVIITARITDTVGVISAFLTYDGADHPMSGPSGSGDWTATISGAGRSAGSSVEYSVTAFDAAGNSVTSAVGKTTWRDCNAPEILSITPTSAAPCAGDGVTITARITDGAGVQSASLVIDNVPYPMAGPTGPGDWSYAITGKGAGESISGYISAQDTQGNTATSGTVTITWKDCIAPVIGSAILEPASPCAGDDVFVRVHITDNVGVTSATISYDGTIYHMSGPVGPANDGDWTATIIGAGKKAGDSISYSIAAKDDAGNAAAAATGSITWIDCTPPIVQSATPSSSTPCAGTEVIITAHVTDDVAVASVDLYFDSAPHAMSGPSASGDWTYTIAGRPAGTSLSYGLIANDGSNPSSPVSGAILWKECGNPDSIGPDILSIASSTESPCTGTDVLITAHLKDDNGVASANLVYDGASHPMSGVAGLSEEYWKFSIPGTSKSPGVSLSYTVEARDALGNLAVSGEFIITWKDCSRPEIGTIAMSPQQPCAGEDAIITVQITDNNGVASAALTAGGADYAMSGPAGSASGEWTATVPGTGKGAGYILIYSIAASDVGGNLASPVTGQIHWRDCTASDIQSVIPSNSHPCLGEDVTVTAHIESNDGVTSAILNFDSSAIPMSGPVGSASGDWTATIPGNSRQAEEGLSYSITAKDSLGRTTVSESQTISWLDCTPPQILEISPGDIVTCEGNGNLQITARIVATAGVVSARIIFEEEGVPGLYEVEMIGQGSDPRDAVWSGTISKRKVRTIIYSITASTGKYTTTSQSHRAVFDECDVPKLIDQQITTPCAGNDAQVSFTIRDVDQDFYRAAISYEGKEYPLHLLGDDPYPKEGIWNGIIPGAGRQPGETLSISLNGYTLDTLGPNPPEGLGQFTVTWLDCKPGILSVTPGSAEVCAGNDQVISARATSSVGISSMMLHYTDSTGQYETSMEIDQGSSLWTESIPDQPAGTAVEYYIIATSTNGDVSRMPQEGSYRLTWIDCKPGILSVTPGSAEVCAGNDQAIRARAISPVGISSMMLYYTDSAGQYETRMVIDDGASPKDASWTGLIQTHPEGNVVEYYIVATSTNGDTARMPQDGSYRLTWVICNVDLNKTASSSTVAPGGTITYTITYRNRGQNDISDVIITENYPAGTIFISASPPPDSGTDNRWTIGDLPGGASGTITIEVRAPDEAKINFFMDQSAKGQGFVRTYKDLNTGREPQVLTNQVSMSARGIAGQFAISKVTISGEEGTKLAMRESGSGTYAREEQLRYLRENRSIKDVSNLSASHQATNFQLPGNESINYNSKWTDREKAKNYVTSESVEESYRYATKINKESQIELDRNGTNMTADSQFEGMRHAGYFKASNPDAKGHVSPLMEMSSDYTGSFRVKERLGTTFSNRSNAITTVKHYDQPHVTIYQRSEIDNTNENNLNYTISILNDGNRTLGPIYLMDLFPAGTSFFDASARPSGELLPESEHVNWTFTSLPMGRSLTIYLTLMRYVVIEPPVNWVYVKAGYDGNWITANNSTISNFNWLSSTPTSTREKMATGDWNPPEWGFDQSEDICRSCTYSPPHE